MKIPATALLMGATSIALAQTPPPAPESQPPQTPPASEYPETSPTTASPPSTQMPSSAEAPATDPMKADAARTDGDFLDKLAQGNMTEIEAGQLAQRKATNDRVREFGAMMVEQHSDAHERVKKVADEKNVNLPDTMSDEQRETLQQLQAVDGPRFDQTYMAEMVKAHEKTVEMLKAEAASGDQATSALAQDLLPKVQGHLKRAYELTGQEDKAAAIPADGTMADDAYRPNQ